MSKVWSEAEREKMKAEAEAHMPDRCKRLKYSGTVNKVADTVKTYTEQEKTLICGIEWKIGTKTTTELTTVVFDAVLRLPIGTEIDERDRVKITSNRGEPVDWVYEITTPITPGISALRCGIKRVEI